MYDLLSLVDVRKRKVEDAGSITVLYMHKTENGIVATLDHRMEYSVGYRII